MSWKDVGTTIEKSLPILGTVLGGPAGGAIGTLVSSALGVSNDADSVNAALAADPAAIEKLKEVELNNKVQLQQLAVTAEQNRLQAENEQFAAEAADRDSARKLAAAQPHDWVRPTIVVILLLLSAAIVFVTFSGMADGIMSNSTATAFAGTVVGLVFSELKTTIAFYFGTNRDAQNQNSVITSFAVSDGTVSSSPKKD